MNRQLLRHKTKMPSETFIDEFEKDLEQGIRDAKTGKLIRVHPRTP